MGCLLVPKTTPRTDKLKPVEIKTAKQESFEMEQRLGELRTGSKTTTKAGKDSKKDIKKKYKNKPPTKEEISLAKKSGKTAKQVSARKKVAANFYEKQGMKESKISGHLQGIDFDKPVQVEQLAKGQKLTQYQVPSASQGNYYAPPGQHPSKLGISEYAQDWNTGEIVKKKPEFIQ